MADDLASIESFLYTRYTDVVGGDTEACPATRTANASAVKTVISNFGPAAVQIEEASNIIAIIQPMTSTELPTPGKGQIDAIAIAGSTTTATVAITTFINS